MAPSTNWLGGNPLKVKMSVRIRLGSPWHKYASICFCQTKISVIVRPSRGVWLFGPIDKRPKSPAFHAGVTGSNPVGITIAGEWHGYINHSWLITKRYRVRLPGSATKTYATTQVRECDRFSCRPTDS